MRLRAGDAEDMIPFFVRPPRNAATADVCVLIPTFTYVVYATIARGNTDDEYRQRVAEWGARPWTPDEHGEYGLSTYNFHTDGSGIAYSSRPPPHHEPAVGLPRLRRLARLGLRHLPADTHLFDWLEEMGHDFDVVTDEDLDARGVWS